MTEKRQTIGWPVTQRASPIVRGCPVHRGRSFQACRQPLDFRAFEAEDLAWTGVIWQVRSASRMR